MTVAALAAGHGEGREGGRGGGRVTGRERDATTRGKGFSSCATGCGREKKEGKGISNISYLYCTVQRYGVMIKHFFLLQRV